MDNVFSGSRNGDDVGHAFGDLDSFLPHDSRPPHFLRSHSEPGFFDHEYAPPSARQR